MDPMRKYLLLLVAVSALIAGLVTSACAPASTTTAPSNTTTQTSDTLVDDSHDDKSSSRDSEVWWDTDDPSVRRDVRFRLLPQ